MRATATSLYRHPVKGFTPERLTCAQLSPDQPFPYDRVFAVEDGPSGFEAENPAHISKTRFAVLAKVAAAVASRFRWGHITPLGIPVVPPVYRNHRSSPDRSMRSIGAVAAIVAS